jgi:malate dehydrogenase (oxaloacetate-decarboxylating)(NADP+)
MSLRKDALEYHACPTPGKISVVPTKPCETVRDLSLSYTPGVAEPCLVIEKDPSKVYDYTSKGNLVAVISNGTAVLGLGDIGPAAGKPVMEGKGVLFKSFADIDVFDLELDCKDPKQVVEVVSALAPTFGGINLEDIKAPECFYIEEELKKRLDIPVFHDDQHGTAIIASAAFLNALELTGRSIEKTRLVVSGAGAAAVACTKLLLRLGLKPSHLLMVDTHGVIYRGRTEGMNPFKEQFAVATDKRTLADALKGADAFFGLSAKGVLKPEMLLTMAEKPIVFAMANPDPEIDYQLARSTRPDAILATGRSDYPNQVNNVLGFPYIFRGALDVRAKEINEAMKLAAVHALAALAKEPVPDSVRKAYGNVDFSFGPNYLIPKPFDPRVLHCVAPAVAEAAIATGVARKNIDLEKYAERLKAKHNQGREILGLYFAVARRAKSKRIAFPEGTNEKVMKAAAMALEEGIARPILLGPKDRIVALAERLDVDLKDIEIIDPATHSDYDKYVETYFQANCRRGITRADAQREIRRAHGFANVMLAQGHVDGIICGVDRNFPSMIDPILQTIGLKKGASCAAGLYLVYIKEQLYFFADVAINITMTAEKLAQVAVMAAEFARSMNIEPKVAMLSFSDFGSVKHPLSQLVREASDLVRQLAPELKVDGEMQADTAVVGEFMREDYPFCALHGAANVLVFPDLNAGNISYKLLQRLGGAQVIGPVILGLNAPAYVVQRHAGVNEIFNMITVAVAQANLKSRRQLSLAMPVIEEKAASNY